MKSVIKHYRTKSYWMTLIGDYTEVKESLLLENLKKQAKEDGGYLQLRGRKPKVKMVPTTWADRTFGTPTPKSYSWAGNIVGGLANATQFDVYFRKYPTKRDSYPYDYINFSLLCQNQED